MILMTTLSKHFSYYLNNLYSQDKLSREQQEEIIIQCYEHLEKEIRGKTLLQSLPNKENIYAFYGSKEYLNVIKKGNHYLLKD